jgi:hypothetical protein
MNKIKTLCNLAELISSSNFDFKEHRLEQHPESMQIALLTPKMLQGPFLVHQLKGHFAVSHPSLCVSWVS